MRYEALLTVCVAVSLASGQAHAQARVESQAFDGRWSVEVITQRGDCDRAYRYAVAVENGRVRYAGPEDFAVSGTVSANGAVRGVISRGNDRANVSGRLSGNHGSGTWTAAGGSRNCSGVWSADKRG